MAGGDQRVSDGNRGGQPRGRFSSWSDRLPSRARGSRGGTAGLPTLKRPADQGIGSATERQDAGDIPERQTQCGRARGLNDDCRPGSYSATNTGDVYEMGDPTGD